MKNTALALLLAMMLAAAPACTLAEEPSLPVIEWSELPTAPDPAPSPDPTAGPYSLNLPWRAIDWAHNSLEYHFEILYGEALDGDAIQALMLRLNDQYAIPSTAHSADGAQLTALAAQALAPESHVAALLIYGFDWTACRELIQRCTERGMPVWFSERAEGDAIVSEIESLFENIYSARNG